MSDDIKVTETTLIYRDGGYHMQQDSVPFPVHKAEALQHFGRTAVDFLVQHIVRAPVTCVEAAWTRALGITIHGDHEAAVEVALLMGIAPVPRQATDEIVRSTRGVLYGASTDTGNGHCMAYDHGRLHCSRQPPTNFEYSECQRHDFHPEFAWAFHPITPS